MPTEDDPRASRSRTRLKIFMAIALLYVFLIGIKLMGEGCKSMAGERCKLVARGEVCTSPDLCKVCEQAARGEGPFVNRLIHQATNPFVALFVGVLVTSIIQSSAVTTSIVVALVGIGTLPLRSAIPIVMGANIGTTVTNMLVSMGYVMRKDEFRRAISGAVVHDLFNVMVVAILLPLELATRFLETITGWLIEPLGRMGWLGGESFNPLGPILKPALDVIRSVGKPEGPGWTAGLTAIIGLAFIFCALFSLIKLLRTMMLSTAETFIGRVVGKSGYIGILIGFILTASVHSSSIVTSLLVPMAASGIMTVTQVFPITIGANIGTTTTALIAALAGSAPGLAIALVHFLFNVSGFLIFYPIPVMRRVPIRLAVKIGWFAAESRRLTILYTFCLFFGVPGLLILISWAT